MTDVMIIIVVCACISCITLIFAYCGSQVKSDKRKLEATFWREMTYDYKAYADALEKAFKIKNEIAISEILQRLQERVKHDEKTNERIYTESDVYEVLCEILDNAK